MSFLWVVAIIGLAVFALYRNAPHAQTHSTEHTAWPDYRLEHRAGFPYDDVAHRLGALRFGWFVAETPRKLRPPAVHLWIGVAVIRFKRPLDQRQPTAHPP